MALDLNGFRAVDTGGEQPILATNHEWTDCVFSGIVMPKQWVAKQMSHTTATMIDKLDRRWTSEDALLWLKWHQSD